MLFVAPVGGNFRGVGVDFLCVLFYILLYLLKPFFDLRLWFQVRFVVFTRQFFGQRERFRLAGIDSKVGLSDTLIGLYDTLRKQLLQNRVVQDCVTIDVHNYIVGVIIIQSHHIALCKQTQYFLQVVLISLYRADHGEWELEDHLLHPFRVAVQE